MMKGRWGYAFLVFLLIGWVGNPLQAQEVIESLPALTGHTVSSPL